MNRFVLAILLCAACAAAANAQSSCLIISEVVDGTLTGGVPKWIEITNTSTADFTFSEGGVIVQSNVSGDVNVDVDLTGVTILAGQSFVVCSTSSGGQSAFESTYGFPANLYTGAYFGNGDDRYIITDTADGSNLLDIYGEFGVDGTGEVWEYTDGFSYRLAAYSSGDGRVFQPDEWFYGGVNSLEGTNPVELLQTLTNPGTHIYDQNCSGEPFTGACCVDTVCSVVTRDECGAAGGVYLGNGTNCEGNPCAFPLGACCIDEECFIMTEADCIAAVGVYLGDNTNCDGNPCVQECSTIAEAKAAGVNVIVRLCNVTISSITDLVNSVNSKNFQMQDDTGGITVYGGNDEIDALLAQFTEGDQITLQGFTDEYNGLFELVGAFIFIENHGFVGIPEPALVDSTDFAQASPTAEVLESQLVVAECVTFVDGGGTFAMGNYTVTDTLGSFTVRIATGQLDIVGQPIPTGTVNVTGIFSQYDSSAPYDSGYQLQPRCMADIVDNPYCGPDTGACCIDGECSLLTETECIAAGGSYQGDNVPCDPNPCIELGCLIVTEVVDGTLPGGVPKWIEITNTSTIPFTFPEGGIIVQTNVSGDVDVDVDLTDVTILPGQAFVICSSGNGGQDAFESTYGQPADLYTDAYFGNGDDRYIITDAADGSNLLDIYGEFGVDGTGEVWEYTDGYSYRLAAFNAGDGPLFQPDEWFFGGVDSLEGPDPVALMVANTTPGQHLYDVECVPESCGGQVLADSNCDAVVNAFDIDPFVLALTDPATWEATYACGLLCVNDINGDGAVDAFDIDGFVECLVGGGCP